MKEEEKSGFVMARTQICKQKCLTSRKKLLCELMEEEML